MVSGFAPAVSMFSSGISNVLNYWWILIPIVIIISIGIIVWWISKVNNKKEQWPHTLIVRRVLQNKLLSKPYEHKMRRFPTIKRADVFELEKPLLGGYLLPAIDKYSGINEYSIVIDEANRIWTNNGEYFDPDKRCVNVSAKHAEIDIQRQNLRANFQNINKVNKRIEWSEIAKYALIGTAIIAFMIIGIVWINSAAKAKQADVSIANAQVQTFANLNSAMKTMQATVNTQKLEILPMLQKLYGNKNIMGQIINKEVSNNTS